MGYDYSLGSQAKHQEHQYKLHVESWERNRPLCLALGGDHDLALGAHGSFAVLEAKRSERVEEIIN